jgi:hypothetical protein
VSMNKKEQEEEVATTTSPYHPVTPFPNASRSLQKARNELFRETKALPTSKSGTESRNASFVFPLPLLEFDRCFWFS